MSRLLVIIRPELVTGFHLAGVEAYPAADVESAVEIIEGLFAAGETCLLAVDDGLLANMDPRLIRRLEATDHLPFIAIPGGFGADEIVFRRQRISEFTRQAIGFHSVFKSEKTEKEET